MTSKKDLLDRFNDLWVECKGAFPSDALKNRMRSKGKKEIEAEIRDMEDLLKLEESMFDSFDDEWYDGQNEAFGVL